MAVPQVQKKKARPQKKVNQKKVNQKVPKQPKQRKQQKRKRAGRKGNKSRDPKHSASEFVSKILPQLCQGKASLQPKDNKKTVFSQRCFLKSHDGQQQCFLSSYVSSQDTCDTYWTAPARPPQISALPSPLWPEGQRQYLFSDAAPLQDLCGQLGTLGAKERQYEAHERMPRQSVMSLFASSPSIPR